MIQYGDVYHLADIPNLDSAGEKDRFLIVLDPRVRLGKIPLSIMCCCASASTTHQTRILLPNRDDHPDLLRGMPRRSWAVPEWIVLARPCLLMGERCTYLTPL